jgi:hypothetical protein
MLLLLLLGSLPFIAVWLLAPDEVFFRGAVVNVDDASVYLSAIRQGAEGEWLFNPNFSIEEWPDVFGYLPYMLFGHLAGLLGGDYQLWFHLLRLLGNFGAVLAFIFWVRVVFPGRRRLQLTAWFFIAFGSGLSWLVVTLFSPDFMSLPDLFVPEWTTVTVLLGMPHFSLGLGFEVIVLGCIIQISRVEQGWKWAIVGALAALGLTLSYPYNTVLVALVIGFQMLHLAFRIRRIPWLRWLQAGIVILPMFTLQAYYAIWAILSPIWPYDAESNFISVPGIPSLIVGLGLLALFAVPGLWLWFKRSDNWLVPIWAIVNFLVLFAPITFAGRFLLGFLVPVATLAAYGVEAAILPHLQAATFFGFFSRLSPTPYESLRRVFIILTIPTTLIVSLMLVRDSVMTFDYPFYLPRTEIAAMEWLAMNAEEEATIFAYYPAGNYLPRISNGRVFLGQLFLTPNLNDKAAMVERFWNSDTSMVWRQDLLSQWNVNYVYEGLFERRLSGTEVAVPGSIVYQKGGVTIYQVD